MKKFPVFVFFIFLLISAKGEGGQNFLLDGTVLKKKLVYSEPFDSEIVVSRWRKKAYFEELPEYGFDEKEKAAFIKSATPNAARLIRKLKLPSGRFYYFTGKIKTRNVGKTTHSIDVGANIGLEDGWISSRRLTGSNDWTEVGVIIPPSKKNEIEIVARLGYPYGTATGTAWFKDLKLYDLGPADGLRALPVAKSVWKVLGIIFTDLNGKGYASVESLALKSPIKDLKRKMTEQEVEAVKQAFSEFERIVLELSEGHMAVDLRMMTVNAPISKVSWHAKVGFNPTIINMALPLEDAMGRADYDSVIAVMAFPEDAQKNYTGRYYGKIGGQTAHYTFVPAGPYMKENILYWWLDQTGNFYRSLGVSDVPDLGSAASFGYGSALGQKSWSEWYRDYIAMRIIGENGKVYGIPANLWQITPRMLYDP